MGEVAELFAARRFVDAIPLREAAIASSPHDWRLFADLTVGKKHARDFEAVRAAGLRALELGAPSDDGSMWNVGIAASALGDWALARRTWTALGIQVSAGDGAIEGAYGTAVVRVGGDAPETVWCRRLCPARARVVSVPLPESGRRFGDLLLHDGEPRGRRSIGEREYPVFDELAVLERSPYATVVIEIDAPAAADVEALETALGDACAALEDWTRSLVFQCAACSAGSCTDHPASAAWSPTRSVAVASTRRIEDELLEVWERGGDGRKIRQVLETE
jgi:hypothetical protein